MRRSHPCARHVLILLGFMRLCCFGQEPAAPWVDASLSASSQRIYQHARVTLTLTISSRNVRLSNNFNLNGLPPLTAMQMSPFKEQPLQRVNKNGVITEIRRFQCEGEAMQPGPLQIAPQLRYGVLTRERGFFGSMWHESAQTLQVRSLKIDILPVPTVNRPGIFSGAVGQFMFDATVTPTEIEVEELIEVKMHIRGDGYVKDMVLPELTPGRHFKVYPRQVEATEGEGISITQTMIPQSTNATHIPGVAFCYFDPIKGQYVTTQKGPFPLSYHSKHTEPVETRYRRHITNTSTGVSAKAESPTEGEPLTSGSIIERRSQSFRSAGAVLSGLGALCLLVAGVYGVRALRHRRAANSGTTRPGRISISLCVMSIGLISAGALLYRMASLEIPKSLISRHVSSYLGPSSQGLVLFELPESAHVDLLETAGAWTKIRYRNSSGWIPSDALADPDTVRE